jgi:hypothetical protein
MGPTRQPLEREERGGKALAGWLGLGRGREGEARGKLGPKGRAQGEEGEREIPFFFKTIFQTHFFQMKWNSKHFTKFHTSHK